ncbi:hypothetical protein BDY21DRAFT_294885 [Lineolata rhizophorae]|uniref:Transglycosylase SLT domain-containing protein n=1 Tax=Lineolata rhizophorae TaxID=578093 RepID=A0A6A6NKY1_9PEZI|nr:hypothetical protein BDY21DRAFT_294885 [Lineolata rhizophorae]
MSESSSPRRRAPTDTGFSSNAAAVDPDNGNWFSSDYTQGSRPQSAPTEYNCFGGSWDSFPSLEDWVSLDTLYELNSHDLNLGKTSDQVQMIKDAIEGVALDSRVDARFIFSVMMQESHANLDVPCTGNGNCGLMQAGVGSVSYDDSNPATSIRQMIEDGVYGTAETPGLVNYLNNEAPWADDPQPGNPFTAARCYNSGSVDPSGDLNSARFGVQEYVNDIANRLVGWGSGNESPFEQTCR